MAITASAVWDIRSTATASNVNGGFFKTGATGTNFSKQDAAQYALTSVGCTASAVLTHASAAADMVGNGLHLISGTNATAGWYEILSVVVGVSITVDRSCASGIGADVVANIGGAISLGAANDDAVFENAVAGNKFYIKNGTYTLGGTVSISAAGTATLACELEGYATTQGDKPQASTRPLIIVGSGGWTFGSKWKCSNVHFNTIADPFVCVTTGTSNLYVDCLFEHEGILNTTRAAVYADSYTSFIRCQFSCVRGRGINNSGHTQFTGCTFEGCDVGIFCGQTSEPMVVDNCIFEACKSIGVSYFFAATGINLIKNCTFYGSEAKHGIGVDLPAGSSNVRIVNSIFYGLTTGIAHGTAGQTMCIDMNNAYYNNTSDTSNWTIGVGSITTAITFTLVANKTGTAATTASGVLTDGAANFSTVTANQDYCQILSGTGTVVSQHRITAKTTTTLTLSPAPADSAVADHAYRVTTGRNYTPSSTNVISTGLTGALNAGPATSYVDIGGVQAQYGAGSATSTDPGVANVSTGTSYNINGTPLVGILALGGGGKRNNLGPVRMG